MNVILLRTLTLRQSYCSTSLLLKQIQRFSSDVSIPPPKPKPPAGVFTLYYTENAERFVQEHAGTMPNQLIQRIGEEWKNASQQERDVYRKRYLQLVEKYKDELVKFEDQLSDDERICLTLQEESDTVRPRRAVDIARPLEFPRRPTTAFGYFIKAAKDMYPKQPNQTIPQWMEEMAQKWHIMTDEEKREYREAGKMSYQKFEERKEDWESVFSLDEVGGFVRR